jgi:ATP-dependent Clp protease ATP-binding subunit ClpB
VSGTAEVYLSPAAKSILETAFEEAAQMKDEYVSTEHILLALTGDRAGSAG